MANPARRPASRGAELWPRCGGLRLVVRSSDTATFRRRNLVIPVQVPGMAAAAAGRPFAEPPSKVTASFPLRWRRVQVFPAIAPSLTAGSQRTSILASVSQCPAGHRGVCHE